MIFSIAILIITVIVLTFMWIFSLKRKVKEKTRLVEASRRELEKKIVIHTHELSMTDTQLQQEGTGRKQAEDALKQSEARFHGAFDSAAIGMSMVTPTGRFIQINPAFYKITGFSEEELLNMNFQSITYPDDREEDAASIAKLLRGDIQFYHREKRYIHKKGHVVWVRLAVSLVRDTEGRPVNLISQVEDISETKQAQDRILKQSALLVGINRVFRGALTCETTNEVGLICLEVAEELTGSRFGSIGELNKAGLFDTIAISNPGWDACELPNQEAKALINNMEIRGIDRSTLRDRESRIVNDLVSHPDRIGLPEGHPPVTSYLGVPLKQGDRTIGLISLGNKEGGYGTDDQETIEALSVAFVEALQDKRNVIELNKHRRNLEELVKIRTEELERSNKELEQFAYVASHDLQEPLRKVQAFSDRLEARYAGVVDDRGRDYIKRMQGACVRMRSMIDDLLSLSRIQIQSEPFAPVEIDEVVREALSEMEMLIEQTGGKVEIGDLPTIDADFPQMRQLFVNLLSNALKFKHKGVVPVLKIFSKPIAKRGIKGAKQCRIIVEDNGIGLEKKFTKRIFIPFERLHGRGEFEGSGIGLSICKRIVERHGGSISAQSELGRGTKLIVTIPLSQKKEGNRYETTQKIDHYSDGG